MEEHIKGLYICEMKKLLTVKDVSNIIGVSEPIVRKLIELEDFPVIRFGRTIKVSEEGLEEWISIHMGTKVKI